VKETSVATRRQFLASALPAAAIAAAALPYHPPPAGPELADVDAHQVDDTWDSGWTVAAHPWGRKFLLAMWAAIEATDEAMEKAPRCNCSACIDLNAYGVVLRMFASSVQCTYCPRDAHGAFPEWATGSHVR
jgi:hypothetical protein